LKFQTIIIKMQACGKLIFPKVVEVYCVKYDYFIISGIFRTGTTLLTRVLDAHAQVSAMYQPITPFFKMWLNIYLRQSGTIADDENIPMGIDTWSRDQYEHFVRHIFDVRFEKRDIELLEARITEDVAHDRGEKPRHFLPRLCDLVPGTGRELVEQLYDIVSTGVTRTQTRCFGIKELWIEEFFLPLGQRAGIKSMHLIRDPRAIYASRNFGKILEQRKFEKYPLLFIVKAWRRSLKYERWNRPRKNEYMLVKYEDFVSDPGTCLEGVCRLLGIDYSDEMKEPAVLKDGKGNRWTTNSSFFTGSGRIYRDAREHWQAVLTDDEVGAIEFLCNREMAGAGYERVQHGFGEKEFLAFKEDPNTLTPWLRKAPFLLSEAQKREELRNLTAKSDTDI
jgi:hypothetical protein